MNRSGYKNNTVNKKKVITEFLDRVTDKTKELEGNLLITSGFEIAVFQVSKEMGINYLKWPKKPKPPLSKILYSIDDPFIIDWHRKMCKECDSSLKRRWKLWYYILPYKKAVGCIQPDCENYWDKN